jgi:hypothetical protein
VTAVAHHVLTADDVGFRFATPVALENESIDVRFGDHRVWSTVVDQVPEFSVVELSWPQDLRAHVVGSGEISVLRSADGTLLASAQVQIGSETGTRQVTDARGRFLAVNKWDHLGVPLDGQDDGAIGRLLDHAEQLIAELTAMGHHPFFSSGSLLGLIRDGALLPHDDDIDLGNLSKKSHPADLVVESLELERSLQAAGHTVIRHSYAHLQVMFLHETGDVDHYIDIFTAYYDPDGTFNQPFSIRGELPRDQFEPFESVELDGHVFPGPARPEAWLEVNYGPGWRIPDPGFRFETPAATQRLFDCWYGTFNLHRDYWNERHAQAKVERTPDSRRVRDELLGRDGARGRLIDVGSGFSSLPADLAADGFAVTATDFSLAALRAQAARVDTRYVNYNDRRSVMNFAWDLLASGEPVDFILNHTLEGFTGETADNLFLLLRWVLRGDSVAIVTVDTELPAHHRFEDPESWHVSLDLLESRAHSVGLAVSIVSEYQRRSPTGPRASTLAVITNPPFST